MANEQADKPQPPIPPVQTFYDLMAIVVTSRGTPEEKQGLIKQLSKANPTSEKALFIVVVVFLGLMALVSVVAMAFSSANSNTLLPVVTGCIGALSGMLVSRGPSDGSPPRPPVPVGGGAAPPPPPPGGGNNGANASGSEAEQASADAAAKAAAAGKAQSDAAAAAAVAEDAK